LQVAAEAFAGALALALADPVKEGLAAEPDAARQLEPREVVQQAGQLVGFDA
jgi:hypothetical protein